MFLYAKRMSFLSLLLTLSACNGLGPDYCALNESNLRPLLIGQLWQPELGLLDDSHSNCTAVSDPPALTWRVRDMEVITISSKGELIGHQAGDFVADGFGVDNSHLVHVEGFVLPENWKMEVNLDQRTTVEIGKEKKVVARALDAEGQSLLENWFFIIPQDSKVLSQRGCLPLRKTHECIITGLKAGKTELRVTLGGVNKRFTVHVH